MGPAAALTFGAEMGFALQKGIHSILRYYQQHQVVRRTADLETHASATDHVHGGRRPRASEGFASAAAHRASAADTAHSNAKLLHAGQNDNAIRPSQNVRWDAIAPEHRAQYRRRIPQCFFVFRLIRSPVKRNE